MSFYSKKYLDFCGKNLINDKTFIFDLTKKFPESNYIYDTKNDYLKMNKKIFKIKLESLLSKLDTASKYNDVADVVHIDEFDPSILGDVNITTKEFLIQYLNKKHKHNENLLFSEVPYSPTFIKHLHPLFAKR